MNCNDLMNENEDEGLFDCLIVARQMRDEAKKKMCNENSFVILG